MPNYELGCISIIHLVYVINFFARIAISLSFSFSENKLMLNDSRLRTKKILNLIVKIII